MKKKKEIMEEIKKQEQNNQPELSNEQKESVSEQLNMEKESIRLEQEESAKELQLDVLEEQIKELQEKIAEFEKQNSELKDAFLRKAAEFENYKRRNEIDQLNLIKYAAEPFIKSILSVYDDLERSLNHINEDNNYDSLKKGLELVYDKFTKILESHGIKKIDAKGQPFDVELHEALMQKPAEGVPPHTVLDIVEHGYIYKDKVIRHAKVIVSAETISEEQKHQDNNTNSNNDNNQG